MSTDHGCDLVMSVLRGGWEAQAILQEIKTGVVAPDALHDALQAVLATNDPHRARAWLRRVQKALELAA